MEIQTWGYFELFKWLTKSILSHLHHSVNVSAEHSDGYGIDAHQDEA